MVRDFDWLDLNFVDTRNFDKDLKATIIYHLYVIHHTFLHIITYIIMLSINNLLFENET